MQDAPDGIDEADAEWHKARMEENRKSAMLKKNTKKTCAQWVLVCAVFALVFAVAAAVWDLTENEGAVCAIILNKVEFHLKHM